MAKPDEATASDLSGLYADDFDAVTYLNSVLTDLNLSTQGASSKQSRSTTLQNATSETQKILNDVNAHNIRTSSELSHLTDDILRSGNRLTYEVEVLRDDVNNLCDVLSEALRDDISQFVQDNHAQLATQQADSMIVPDTKDVALTRKAYPEFMQRLRQLSQIKARLEAVVHIFGEALKWPVPPSDVSMAPTLISISAPELGVQSTAEDDQARATIRRFREEISELLKSEGGGYAGLEAANARVTQFQDLSVVWKGTIEEKPRNRAVDSFVRIVDERKRVLDSQNRSMRDGDGARQGGIPYRATTQTAQSGGGLFGGLRKLRDEIYLD